MKTKTVLLFALCLLLSLSVLPYARAEEAGSLGEDFRIDPDLYESSFVSGIGMYEVKSRTSDFSFFLMPVTYESLGMKGEIWRSLLPDLQGKSLDGITYGSGICESGSFLCIPFSSSVPVMYGILAMGQNSMLYVYSGQGENPDACLELLRSVLETGAAESGSTEQKQEIPSGPVSAEDLFGYYDCELLGELDPDIVLILTPGGHGRLSNSTSSVTFDYDLSNGRIVPDTDQITLSPDGTGRILCHTDYLDITFVRRPPVSGNWDLTGSWSLTEMEGSGSHYSSSSLKLLGISIDFTAYDDGSIDWFAVSDSISRVAQGWGIDDTGLYFHNGERVACTLDGNRLTMRYAGGSRMIFDRQPDSGQESLPENTPESTPEKEPENTRLPLVTDYISTEMKDWKKEIRDSTTCYTLVFAGPLSDDEIASYVAALTELLPLRIVAQGREDASAEIVSVIRNQYAFLFEGESDVEPAVTHLVGSYEWTTGGKNTSAHLKMVTVQEADDPINQIALYLGRGLTYDDSEESRLSEEALAARPTPVPTETPVPETEQTGVRIPWVTDYLSGPLKEWQDLGIHSDGGRNLLLKFAEPFDEAEIDSYIQTLASNKNFTLIAHGVRDRSEQTGILCDIYDFRYDGPETILTVRCNPDLNSETEWVLGGWNYETNLVVYVIRNTPKSAWNISLYLSPDMTYDAEEADRVLRPEGTD